MESAKIVQLIEMKFRRGRGTQDDHVRIVTQYWTTDGKLVAEIDPHNQGNYAAANVLKEMGVVEP